MGKIYEILCMNKFMNTYKIKANSAKEALDILVDTNLSTGQNAIYSKTDTIEMVEFCGYKFMVKK